MSVCVCVEGGGEMGDGNERGEVVKGETMSPTWLVSHCETSELKRDAERNMLAMFST